MRRLRKTGSVRTRTDVWVRNPQDYAVRIVPALRSGLLTTLRKGGLALLLLWVCLASIACTAGQKAVAPIRYHDGPTDVDVEQSQLRAVSRYRQLRQAHRYRYDNTEVDLATPLAPSEPVTPTTER